jgi:hypothetical protein
MRYLPCSDSQAPQVYYLPGFRVRPGGSAFSAYLAIYSVGLSNGVITLDVMHGLLRATLTVRRVRSRISVRLIKL